MLLRRLFHAFREKHLELKADILGLAFEFMEELALLILDFAVGKEHLPEPGGFVGVNPAVRQNMILDGLVEELLEGRSHMLNPLVQFNKEVGLAALDLAASVHLLAQRRSLGAIDPPIRQNGLFDFL
jgi:hypothetical protein